MYLPSYNFSSKSDFGSMAPAATLLDHSARRLSEYKAYWPHASPGKWSVYHQPHLRGPSAAQPCLGSPGRAVYHREQLYAAPAFHPQVFTGDTHGFPGSYTAPCGPEAQRYLRAASKNRILPSAFDHFFDYALQGDVKSEKSKSQTEKETFQPSDWTRCQSGESAAEEKEAPDANEDEKEKRNSEAPSEYFPVFVQGKKKNSSNLINKAQSSCQSHRAPQSKASGEN